MPTACTVSYSAWFSPAWLAALIQLADRLMRSIPSMRAQAMFITASPIAMRPEAAGSISASGVRSPMLIASPAKVSKAAAVTAQSATGTCQGPTICSRATRPVTERSPMVIRKDFNATVGSLSTRSIDSTSEMRGSDSFGSDNCLRSNWRCIFGGLPSSTCIGMSTGWLLNSMSLTTSWRASVASPSTA